jgi:hypothetical protein
MPTFFLVAGGGGGSGTATLSDELVRLEVSGAIAASTAINIQSSGVNYSKIGDNINLPANASLFNDAGNLNFFRNGQKLVKGEDVIWVSTSQVNFIDDLLANDIISIIQLEVTNS